MKQRKEHDMTTDALYITVHVWDLRARKACYEMLVLRTVAAMTEATLNPAS